MNHRKLSKIVKAMIDHYEDRALLVAMFRIHSAQEKDNYNTLVRWQKIADAIEQQLMSHSLIESSVH